MVRPLYRSTDVCLRMRDRMKTPITIKHTLATEVFFSIYGQDEMGKPMVRHGAGGLQVLRFDEPVFLPAVGGHTVIADHILSRTVHQHSSRNRIADM